MSENIPEDTPELEPDEWPETAPKDTFEEESSDTFEEDFEDESEEESGASRSLIILIIAVVALIICGALAIIVLVLRPFQPEAPPTMVATAEPIQSPAATEAGPGGEVDPVWAKIQASGIMVVGTSADYPPFEFYTDDFQLDGFDVALMQEIGRKLGLQVELKDMAFDGLGGALQVNQIDVAASAISYTPERDQFIDFSNTYFLSEDAALGAADSTITLVSADDLADYRLGVQSGTIYENFAQTALVETGKMPEHNLFIYPQMNTAIEDLAEGQVDLVLLDKAPADQAVAQGNLKVIATGFSRQQIALAIPQDSFTLRSELNRALGELQAEGRVAELFEEYFNIDSDLLPPIPTPDPEQPTPTPAPPQDCIDAMQWVADLSHDDSGLTNIPEVPPGTAFQKGWRVRNTGTCTWDSGYMLVPVRGNTPAARMGGLPTPVQGTVAPGQTYDFWVNLTAPIDPGTYVEYWTMSNPSNVLFGDVIWVAVNVPAAATPTPVATQTPSASISFTADPEVIQQGQCSTLSWSSSNVQAVYVYPQGEDWRNYGVPGTGTQTVCPSETQTYDMRVVKLDGSVEIRRVTVTVIPNAQAPQISRFTVEPPYSVTTGQCVVITWVVEGNVSTVNISRNEVVIWPSAPFSGNMQDCPQSAGQYVYKIDASGTGGNSVASQTIQVIDPATPTPIPTTAPEQPTNTPLPPATATPKPEQPTPLPDPVIYSFSATPNEVEIGHCVTVAWSVGGNTSLVQILKNGAVVLDNAALRDSVQDCELNQAGTVTYGIEASNKTGGLATDQASVTVHESKPDNPLANTNWQLIGYLSGGQLTPVLDKTSVGISFHDGGGYAGNGGCNSYSGKYTVNGSQIAMTAPTGTSKACEDDVMQQENTYFGLLPTAATYQTADGQLMILDNSGQVILQYTQLVATPF
jgi:polar amino acid transport system substrate-binding protein